MKHQANSIVYPVHTSTFVFVFCSSAGMSLITHGVITQT